MNGVGVGGRLVSLHPAVTGSYLQRAASLQLLNFRDGASIFTTDPAERRGSRDKRRISLAVASELVLVEDCYERPQRYCQMTGLMWKCSPNNQRPGPACRAGRFGLHLQPSEVLRNLFFSGDQGWAEFTVGCMNVSAGSSSLFTQSPIYHRAAKASPHAESAASGEV